MNTENQLKSKLIWLKCPKSMKLEQKWNKSNDTQLKMLSLLGYNLKLLFSGGNCYSILSLCFFSNQTHANDIQQSQNFPFQLSKLIWQYEEQKAPQKDFSCAERLHSQICIYSTFCFNHSALNIERGTITKCNAELLKTISASLLMNSARLIDLISNKWLELVLRSI